MKKSTYLKVISSVLILFGMSIFSAASTTTNAANYGQDPKIGEELKIPNSKVESNTYVLDIKNCDVTGDNVNDIVILAGKKDTPDMPYSFSFTIAVRNGLSGDYQLLSAGQNGGYEGQIFIGDFNGDKIPDILVDAASGGSGGTYFDSILSFANGKPSVLLDQEKLSSGAQFEGKYKDGFKASVKSLDLDKSVELDISNNKKDYLINGIYDMNGKLLTEVEVYADGYGLLKPIDRDNDGVYELEGYQRLWGFYHLDIISHAHTVWKYQDGSWKLKLLELSTPLLNEY